MDSAKALAVGLKRFRKRLGWTQAELAEKSGLSVQFIAALEQQGRSATLETLDRLGAALDVSAAELLAGDEPRPRRDADIVGLVAGFTDAQREHVVAILRELRHLGSGARRGKG